MKYYDSNRQHSLAHFTLMMTLLIFGYEWFISGLDKVASGNFVQGLHNNMIVAIKTSSYAVYSPFLKSICLPHCIFFGRLIEYGEVLIGTVFIVIALLGIIKGYLPHIAELIGLFFNIFSIILSLNILLYVGGKFFFSTSDPFDEGISLDFIMLLVSVIYTINFTILIKRKKSLDNNIARSSNS